jgi:hypothetical protein
MSRSPKNKSIALVAIQPMEICNLLVLSNMRTDRLYNRPHRVHGVELKLLKHAAPLSPFRATAFDREVK